MAEAMISGLLKQNLAEPHHLLASDPRLERVEELQQKYQVQPFTDNNQAAKHADVVVLSVKPQRLTEVLSGLKSAVPPQALVLSIVTGATIAKISNGLDHKAVVRSMPNTPAQIGEGMTVWTAKPEVSAGQKKLAGNILGAMGKQLYVDDERYLDMATAVSGSGPAYLFYFVESLVDAAIAIGWTREQAKELVMATVLGAAQLLKQSGKEAADLRQAVTSKGGTTAAALGVLEEGMFRELVAKAIKAAHDRAIELGGGKR